MARRYIDELIDGVKASESSPLNDKRVLISLETAQRLKALYDDAKEYDWLIDDEIGESLDALNEEMQEPKP